jgi:hypothetical protein
LGLRIGPDQANLRDDVVTHFNYYWYIDRRHYPQVLPQATTLLNNILIHGLSKPAASLLWTDAHSGDEWYTISANPVLW